MENSLSHTALIFIFSWFAGVSVVAQQQIENGGFEEINPNVQFPEDPYPENWTSEHSMVIWQQYPCLSVPLSGEVTTDSYAGEYAIKMESKGCDGEHVIPGGYRIGSTDLGPGHPFYFMNTYTSRPESFSFYFKFSGVDGDSAQYAMALLTFDSITPGLSLSERLETVGFVNGYLSENVDSYTQFIAPIEYTSEDFPSLIMMRFLSGVGCLSNVNCSEGTTLWVDQVELLGEALNVQEEGISERGITLFPNPANNSFRIRLKNDVEPRKLILFDNLGKEIKRWPEIEESYSLEGLDSGTYIIGVETSETTYFKRLVKN